MADASGHWRRTLISLLSAPLGLSAPFLLFAFPPTIHPGYGVTLSLLALGLATALAAYGVQPHIRFAVALILLLAGGYVGVVLCFGVLTPGGYYAFTSGNYGAGEHAARVDWLPAEATDVSYRMTGHFEAFEFSISESGFREWCRGRKYEPIDLAELDGDFDVTRYDGSDVFVAGGALTERLERHGDLGLQARLQGDASARVTDGLYFEEYYLNGGGPTVVFSRQNDRAYFEWHSH